jgi:hypothetical protein
MHRRCFLLFISAILIPFSLFAQEEAGWLCLQRLSLTASGGYSYRPWNKLNESLRIATEAVNYDPAYPSPIGSAQKILGDITGELALSYRIAFGLRILVVGDITATSSNTTVQSAPTFGTETTQDLHFKMLGYGAGAEYRFELGEALDVTPFIVICQEHATIDYSYHITWDPSYGYWFDARLKDSRMGICTGIRFAFHIVEGVSVISGIEYRHVEFPNLHGDGTFVPLNNELPHTQPFEAVLAEGNGYFGIVAKSPSSYIPSYLLRTLWWRAGPAQSLEDSITPTSLDLSAFGITLGVRIDF